MPISSLSDATVQFFSKCQLSGVAMDLIKKLEDLVISFVLLSTLHNYYIILFSTGSRV